MENVTKLEEQEINQLKGLQQLEKIKQEEKTLADNLSSKYGNGTINIEEGTFTN